MLDGFHFGNVWEPLCFFLMSVGYTMGWTTISSMLASFKDKFGPAVLLQLNLAYFLPSIPVLILQNRYDSAIDQRFGLPQAMSARMVLGMGGAGIICAVFPFFEPTRNYVLAMTVSLGVCCGVAFASSYQLVSRFGPLCSKALTVGFVGSGPVVLFLQLVDHIGPNPAQSQRILLYIVVSFFSFLGLVAALTLLGNNWDALLQAGRGKPYWSADSPYVTMRSMESDVETSVIGNSSQTKSASPAGTSTFRLRQTPEGSELSSLNPTDSDSSWSQESVPSDSSSSLWWDIWPAAVALGSSVGCATLLFPFFTFIPTSGLLGPLLPQAVFFARTIADILGRFIPHTWLPSTRRGLHAMTIVKLAAMPLAFWYIMAVPFRSDTVVMVYISLFWLQSGAVNSISFVLADEWSHSAEQGKAGGFLALTFQLSCLVALAIAFVMQRYCSPFKSAW